VCEKLLDNLKMKVDAVQCQKHLPAIYGTTTAISGPQPDFSGAVPSRRNRMDAAGMPQGCRKDDDDDDDNKPIKDDNEDNKPIKEEEGVSVVEYLWR
jgi:hypothetical protein